MRMRMLACRNSLHSQGYLSNWLPEYGVCWTLLLSFNEGRCCACKHNGPLVCLGRIPHPPDENLLLGSALTLRRPDHHRTVRAWAKQLGGVYAVRIGLKHVGFLGSLCSCVLFTLPHPFQSIFAS